MRTRDDVLLKSTERGCGSDCFLLATSLTLYELRDAVPDLATVGFCSVSTSLVLRSCCLKTDAAETDCLAGTTAVEGFLEDFSTRPERTGFPGRCAAILTNVECGEERDGKKLE